MKRQQGRFWTYPRSEPTQRGDQAGHGSRVWVVNVLRCLCLASGLFGRLSSFYFLLFTVPSQGEDDVVVHGCRPDNAIHLGSI